MEKNFAIITRIDWNSNQWKDLPTENDLLVSEFKKHADPVMGSLLFGHSLLDEQKDVIHQGFMPQFKGISVKEKQENTIVVVFVVSRNPEDKLTYIIGLYAFPQFSEGKILSPYEAYETLQTNIKTEMKNIHHLENYIKLQSVGDNDVFSKKIIGKNGYVPLTKVEMEKVFDALTKNNSNDKRLHSIKFRLLKSYL